MSNISWKFLCDKVILFTFQSWKKVLQVNHQFKVIMQYVSEISIYYVYNGIELTISPEKIKKINTINQRAFINTISFSFQVRSTKSSLILLSTKWKGKKYCPCILPNKSTRNLCTRRSYRIIALRHRNIAVPFGAIYTPFVIQ